MFRESTNYEERGYQGFEFTFDWTFQLEWNIGGEQDCQGVPNKPRDNREGTDQEKGATRDEPVLLPFDRGTTEYPENQDQSLTPRQA